MNFRWVVFITLWTCLAGPILAPGPRSVSRSDVTASARSAPAMPVTTPDQANR